ncbi:MAG: MBOAT family protein [Eubacterium sp.]|nr:MBOAT family protein [Eubacterium sp.]MCM1303369.1 MBOAT family protein [Butyrivibrio sp.]MCM1342941.1 MBOAT family protein [Muribaculaceae bacterium]MCM1411387.1 MBOAT family protein [Lachnospiraceae bacterium]
MVFSSTVFLFLFLPAVLLVYYNPFVKGQTFRNIVLLFASLGFYAWGEPVYVFLLLFSIILTYSVGLWMAHADDQKTQKKILTVGIACHVIILFIFKYLSFLLSQLGLLSHSRQTLSITLPIGISFFTFQMMSYLFDVYYKKAEVQKNILYVGLYVAFFPQLIAGPIVRYDQIADQLKNRTASAEGLTLGMYRFTIGLAKKVLLANYLAVIADNIFDIYIPEGGAVLTAWLGAIAYTLQIYFDFSGYSDMAIGLGHMFGFTFPENFNYPYAAKTVTDFWRRWHISLSGWFRDYVYIPLGGNRVTPRRWIFNLFIVWLLTGIWHGANWTFLVWGLFYFLLLLIEKTTHFTEKLGIFSHIYTLLAVCLAWVVFRSESLSAALHYLGTMIGIGAKSLYDGVFVNYITHGGVFFLATSVLAFPLLPFLRKRFGEKFLPPLKGLCTLALFLFSLLLVIGQTYNPFIYFNF